MLHQLDLKKLQLPWQKMANGKIPGVTFTPDEIREMTQRAVEAATLDAVMTPFDADAARARVRSGQIISPTPEQQKFSDMIGEFMTFDADAARNRVRAARGLKPKPSGAGE